MNRTWLSAACVLLLLKGALSGGVEDAPTTRPAETAALEAHMRATVGRLVAGLGAGNYKVRQASEEALVALHEKYLDLVLTAAETIDPEVQARLKLSLIHI